MDDILKGLIYVVILAKEIYDLTNYRMVVL
jgi:hypothetical protein